MRKQDHLIALIKSLTGTEKRQFVQMAKTEKRHKGYLKLYNALLHADHYDANELSLTLGKKKTDLANEKKYLEKVLMKALRNIRTEQPHVKAINSLIDANILIDKGLFELAAAKLKRAIDEAKRVSFHNIEWHAHGLMLTVASEPNEATNRMQDVTVIHLEGLNECARKMSITSEMELLSFRVYEAYDDRHFDQTESDRAETHMLIEHPLLNVDHTDQHIEFQKYNLLTLLYSRLRDTEAAVRVTAKWVSQVEKQDFIEPNEYITALSCHAQALISHGEISEIRSWLSDLNSNRYRNLPVDGERMKTLLGKYLYWHRSTAYYLFAHKGEKLGHECSQFVDDHIQEWEDTVQILSANHFITATVRIACCSLLMGRAQDALSMLNRLFNEFDMNVHPRRWGEAKTLYAMTLLSIGEYKLFPSAVKNAIYFLKKRELYQSLDRLVLAHFAQLPVEPEIGDVAILLKDLGSRINEWNVGNSGLTPTENLPYLVWSEQTFSEL
ncbi:MAG: hypothetical protein H6601_07245 [Flavobacteriales bacterium]|nr:hypothetical protein [Flavobacteriales bacterium]MCB9186526.1 hypothetical protein [Flavobacteriales bacterium]